MNRIAFLGSVLAVGLGLGACAYDIHSYNGDEVGARDIDVLFVIDDATDHANYDAIAAQVGDLQASLTSIDGQLPSLHVGVVTTDLGVSTTSGAGATVGACNGTGKGGKLQKFTSTATGDFLSDERGGTKNYTGDLATELKSLTAPAAATGGCEFGQPLEAMKKALTESENPGFVRDDAQLAVIFLTNNDDCSLASPALLADTAIADPALRCNKGGDSLVPVPTYVTFLEGLKERRSDISVSAVAGVQPVQETSFGTLATCQGPGGVATPAVRTASVVKEFGGAVVDSCTPTNAYNVIGSAIAAHETLCVPSTDVERCEVEDGDTKLAKCASASDAGPCWVADTASGMCGSDQSAIRVKRGSAPAAADSHIHARCFIN